MPAKKLLLFSLAASCCVASSTAAAESSPRVVQGSRRVVLLVNGTAEPLEAEEVAFPAAAKLFDRQCQDEGLLQEAGRGDLGQERPVQHLPRTVRHASLHLVIVRLG